MVPSRAPPHELELHEPFARTPLLCSRFLRGSPRRSPGLRDHGRGVRREGLGVNYYRRWIADYQAKTQHLSMAEEGAYTRLLDFCYAHEGPLPANQKELFRIAKAVSRSDRKAVTNVVDKFFVLMHDGYHNARADEEMGVAKQAIEKQREEGKKAAEKRWGKHRSTHNENDGSTHAEVMGQPNGLGYGSAIQPPTSNQEQPRETTPATATGTTAGVAGKSKPNPEVVAHIDRLRVTAAQGSDLHAKVGELYGICAANSIRCSTTHPLLLDWAREGLTPANLTRAITEARKANSGQLNPAYLDPIIERIRNGTIDAKAPPAPLAASHSPAKAQQAIAEGLQAKQNAVPMPEHLAALYARKAKPA